MILTKDQHHRIEEAVTAAESHTWGEIVCVVAREASDYREVALAWATIMSLVLPPITLVLGIHPLLLTASPGSWTAAHGGSVHAQIAFALSAYAMIQVVLFVLVWGLVSVPQLRNLATPNFIKRERVRSTAVAQFQTAAAGRTDARTGVLIFVSMMERQVEVIADKAIHDLAGQAVWDQVVADVQAGMKAGDPASGIIKAVELVGVELKKHFPHEGEDVNAISNEVIEI
ncbi:MAG: TPM domain-containing protein [Caulobacteraceae bacterium]